MQALVIRISRDVYVLDITVNFMLNKRKSKKRLGLRPRPQWGSYQRSLKPPLLSREGARPLLYPPPVVNIFIRPPLSGSAPAPLLGYTPTAPTPFVSAHAHDILYLPTPSIIIIIACSGFDCYTMRLLVSSLYKITVIRI